MSAFAERLKWRSRRGLLELDIVFERFWARAGDAIGEGDAAALERLLALPDNDLLDLVMGRAETTESHLRPMLQRLRTV
ncbi:MAG TPA: succinate dehydrogenase assembly factor 2 [Usitatibacter sp.]|nr:succinate dehydrogenase assembly factor 2 [Usitatibacter sp.]